MRIIPRGMSRDRAIVGHATGGRRHSSRDLKTAFCALAVLLPAPAALAQAPQACNIPAVVAHALPSVVNITVVRILHKDNPEAGKPPVENLEVFVGSGFIIDPSGLIVTNKHVIQDSAVIRVTFQNHVQVPAQLVAAAHDIDLALLKVNLPHPLPAVSFGNSDALQLGQRVIAIGNPLGIGTSISTGVLSGENRDLMRTPFDNYLQTDATINPGNSGGPLLDCSGHVIGVDTALYSNSTVLGSIGLGFALPANDVNFVVTMLRNPDGAPPNWVGLHLQDVSAQLSEAFTSPVVGGAIVTGIDPDSPAARAGFRTGDIITAFDGRKLPDSRAAQRAVVQVPAGQPITMTVWREHHPVKLTVTGVHWPHMMALRSEVLASAASIQRAEDAGLGLQLSSITADDRKQFDLGDASGVLISEVTSGSQAETMSLRAGNVIEQIGDQTAPTLAQVRSQLMISGDTPGKLVALLVRDKAGARWRTLWVGRIDPKDLVADLMAGPNAMSAHDVTGRKQ